MSYKCSVMSTELAPFRTELIDQICSRGAKKKNFSRGAIESGRGADVKHKSTAEERIRGAALRTN